MSMREFAQHVIKVGNEYAGGISNLQLQKIMYFALGDYIKDHGIEDEVVQDIYDEPFQAWTYGPVVETEYHRYKKYGRYFIRESGQENELYEDLNDYITEYLDWSVTDLVEESHKHSTWSDNMQLILQKENVEYDLEDLEYDFAEDE